MFQKENAMRRATRRALITVAIMSFAVMGCTSEEELERRKKAAFEDCIDDAVSKCERACSSDPKFVYCGIVYMDQVLGSGCTAEMDALSYEEKVEKCKSRACSKVKSEAWDACWEQHRR